MMSVGGSEIAVVLLDENGTILDAHASCAETFGWERSELLGKDVRELLQFGRDLLMSQLALLENDDSAGNTSFSVRVLARKKDQRQFPARATVRRFQELECWTVAFYRIGEQPESPLLPNVSPEEISLAKRALEAGTAPAALRNKKEKLEAQRGENKPVKGLWRNSRLLFSTREDKSAEVEAHRTEIAGDASEQQIMEEAVALVAECEEASPSRVVEVRPEPVAPAVASTPAAQVAQIVPAAPRPAPVPLPAPPAPGADVAPGLAKLKAELERERGEKNRAEHRCASLTAQVQALHVQLGESLNLERENQSRVSALETELREAQDQLADVTAQLASERRDRQCAQDQLALTRELNTRLEQNLGLAEEKQRNFQKTLSEFQAQLDRDQTVARDLESKLDLERQARHAAEESLSAITREHRTFQQNSAAEAAQLKALLDTAELENARAQEQVLRTRSDALELGRSSRAEVDQLKKDFTQLLHHIDGTTRELLQSPLTDEQKCVIEALLQDVVALQTRIEQEPVHA